MRGSERIQRIKLSAFCGRIFLEHFSDSRKFFVHVSADEGFIIESTRYFGGFCGKRILARKCLRIDAETIFRFVCLFRVAGNLR